jgi:hypothetical protein
MGFILLEKKLSTKIAETKKTACMTARDVIFDFIILRNDLNDDTGSSLVGQVERRLLRLFQNDFLGLLQTFRRIDRSKSNLISKQEFRAAIESHFSIEISDAEFDDFIRDIPKDGNKIKYLEFMTRFDSDSASSLFDGHSI